MPNDIDALLISLVSACTALVASIVGPVVTLVVSKRQFSASVLSANRQKWIESLRDLLAEGISLLIAALIVRERWKDKWNKGRGAVAADPALLEKVQRLALAQAKVRLMINPQEDDHLHLHQAIMVSIKRLQSEDALESETEDDIEVISKLAQSILKREWQRVKAGT